ncbi:methyltransferase, TIGR04325 family [Ferrovibrio xuzhouensis]|uniref:Methyltransferase, TIGR04325 family n=1 Tax=Ferrovibrio xuzhouensis TaxID=1576914 RepID=A0ABV7VNJ9_9PROT
MKRIALEFGNWRAVFQLGRKEPEPESICESSPTGNWFEIGFSSWQDAKARSTGYETDDILLKASIAARRVRDGHAAYERDTVAFEHRQVVHPVLAWLMYAVVQSHALRVMDFGGALGSLYFQHRFLLDRLPDFIWGVVEQAHFIELGQAEFQTDRLHFYPDIDRCVADMQPNFALLSGVLQYLEKPYAMLDQILGLQLPFVLIDRTMAHGAPDQLTVQHVAPNIYEASYPVWMLDAARMEAMFATCGYEVLDSFDPHPGANFGPVGQEAPYKGWFLVNNRWRR